jgi:hypothetical protein
LPQKYPNQDPEEQIPEDEKQKMGSMFCYTQIVMLEGIKSNIWIDNKN